MDAEALKASWALVAAQGDDAAEVFYAVLFTAAPRLRGMFPPSMTVQRDRLLHALGHIVSHVDDAGLLTGFAAQLGRDHRKYGVLTEHYPLVGQALLETLRRTLRARWTPGLAQDWATAYQTVATVMSDAAQQAAAGTPAWWLAEVTGVQRRAPEITVFTVCPDYPYDYLPGQSLAVESERRPRVWRYLSPANAPRPDGVLEFHVRAVPGGMLSPALVYQLQPGDTVRLGPPVGHTLTGYRHNDRDLLLIAGGTGLAPLSAIVDDLAATGTGRAVTLVVGAATAPGLYDRDRLRNLAVRLPQLAVIGAVQHGPLPGGARRGSAVEAALRAGRWDGFDIYLCGPPGMVTATRALLLASGYPVAQVHAEDYTKPAYPTVTDHALRR